MARIRNIVMEGATGRLGGMVLTQRPGTGTVARSLAPEVNNPKTEAQQGRRVKWANLVNFYKISKGWMSKAFENKANNQSDYNKFMSLNANTTLVALTKEQASQGGAIAGPYTISQGSLPSVELTQLSSGAVSTNIALGNLTIGTNTTIAEFSAAVLQNNAWLKEGMQLSFISYQQATNGVTGVPYVIAGWYEVTFNTNDTRVLNNVMPVSFAAASVDNNGKYLGTGAELSAGSFAYVVSSRQGSKILVSSQQLKVYNNDVYNYAISSAALQKAIESYGLGIEVFLAPGYTGDAQSQTGSNSISSVNVGNKDYTPGQDVIPLDNALKNNPVKIYFTNPLSADEEASVVIRWHGSSASNISTSATITGNQVSVSTWSPAISVLDYIKLKSIVVTLGSGKEYSVEFPSEKGTTTVD